LFDKVLWPNLKGMAMLLYRLLFLPALLLALPRYLIPMWRRGGNRHGFLNRLGFTGKVPAKSPQRKRIWIQAVSVGELNAVAPLIRELNKREDCELLLTTTTSTGYAVIRRKYSGKVCWTGIFPFDFWPISSRTWRNLEPDLALLMEGELWPEHIHQAYRRKVPILLINARISDRTFARHQSMRWLSRTFFSKLSAVLAGSESDLGRFRDLNWVAGEQLHLTGNLKLDVPELPGPSPEERCSRLREFGFCATPGEALDRLVLLGSSTWPGEEEALLEVFAELSRDVPGLRLVIVPRHAERRSELKAITAASGLPFHFRSESEKAPTGTKVYLADTTGELTNLTRFADLVFIGRSLPPNAGGQTPIEAAGMGKPICFGPSMSNFRDVTRLLLEKEAALRIPDRESLREALAHLLRNPDQAAAMGRRARALIVGSRGATKETLRHLVSHFSD